MKNLRLQLIAAAAAFLIPQMIGVGMATVALNGGRTWGPATFSIILGLFLMIGPIWAIMTIKQFEDHVLTKSDRRFWLLAEMVVLIFAAFAIILFDVDELKLLWSAP